MARPHDARLTLVGCGALAPSQTPTGALDSRSEPGRGREAAMIAAIVAVTILVALTILIHYEILRLASALIPNLAMVWPRGRVVLIVFACFVAHTCEVWMFAFAYYVFVEVLGLGGFGGIAHSSLADHVYFSAVTYTSLGFGDVYPLANVRLISGVEALVGLMMIGWSASFTYLAMEEFWPLHGPVNWRITRKRRRHARHQTAEDSR